MKFEDMKKIWNEQNQQHNYVIDEQQLHKNISEKKKRASKFIGQMEWLGMAANVIGGGAILISSFVKGKGDIFTIPLGVMMLAFACYIFISRHKRLKGEDRFDRTLLGDLDHAISNVTYRTQLSYYMLLYFIPVGLLLIANAIQEGLPLIKVFLIVMFVIVSLFLGRWEHRSWHLAQKKRLEAMREKLVEPV